MATKLFYFDFFQCTTLSALEQQAAFSTSDVFHGLLSQFNTEGQDTVKNISGRLYELRLIEETEFGFRGILGKHRQTNLPHAAIAGGLERELELADNENLLEKAYFHYYSSNSLLVIQKNRVCYKWDNLSRYFSNSTQNTIINPILQPVSLDWLMRDEVRIKTLEIGIARPRNLELFEGLEHNFNNAIVATLNGSNSAKINLTLRGDARAAAPEDRYLGSQLKRAFSETLEHFEVEKLKLDTKDIDNDIDHPIDLIADRMRHFSNVEMLGRYPLAAEMWNALVEAKASKDDELDAYFGNMGQRAV